MESLLTNFKKCEVLHFLRWFDGVAADWQIIFQGFLRLFPQPKCNDWSGMAAAGLNDQS